MSYSSYLREFEERIISEIPQRSDELMYSDLTPSTDEIMYSNAKALDIYGQGKRFQIEDNVIFYEVIKIVREIIDKHFYQYQVQFDIQVANKEVMFTFIVDRGDAKFSYFIETLFMFISNQLIKNYKNFFDIIREDGVAENNKVVLKITVRKSENSENT